MKSRMILERLEHFLPMHDCIDNLNKPETETDSEHGKQERNIWFMLLSKNNNVITSGFLGNAYVKIAFNISRKSLKKSVKICNSAACKLAKYNFTNTNHKDNNDSLQHIVCLN